MNGNKRPSQRKRVLALLKAAGARGVRTNEFLTEHLPRFSARIWDLRQEGYVITTRTDPQSASGVIYTLRGKTWTPGGALRQRKRSSKVEERLAALMAQHDGRVSVVCRPRPASPETRWTISTAPDGQYPDSSHVWIGETLDEALTRAEQAK